jgi:hypothetical protein
MEGAPKTQQKTRDREESSALALALAQIDGHEPKQHYRGPYERAGDPGYAIECSQANLPEGGVSHPHNPAPRSTFSNQRRCDQRGAACAEHVRSAAVWSG